MPVKFQIDLEKKFPTLANHLSVEALMQPNWDGYGADAVSADTLQNTMTFLEALPLGSPLPSLGSEPDGHITLEWYQSPTQLLSISIDADSSLCFAALLGNEDQHGECQFDREIPQRLLDLISRIS